MWCLIELLCTGEEFFLSKFSIFCVIGYIHCESGVQLSTDCLRRFLGHAGLYCVESDCDT